MKTTSAVYSPLLTDLQRQFKVQCSISGNKGLVFLNPADRVPREVVSRFSSSTGFVPFRKTFAAGTPPWHHKKTNTRDVPSGNKLSSATQHSWKIWNANRKRDIDARDALYFYSKENKSVENTDLAKNLPGLFPMKHARPQTVASSSLPKLTKKDPNGYRRSYTALERNKTEQAKVKRAYLIGTGFSARLLRGQSSSLDVKNILLGKGETTRSSSSSSVDESSIVNTSDEKHTLPVRRDRPMKKEIGRYRPISRTTVKTPDSQPDKVFTHIRKDPKSAEAFKIMLATQRAAHARRQVIASRNTSVGILDVRHNVTRSSHFDDTDTHLLQSVIDVNRPSSRLTSAQTAVSVPCGEKD